MAVGRGTLGGMRPADAPIDAYLRQLAGHLHGPRRQKADVIAEARGSLEDAADAYRESGLDARAAQVRAVAEFGDARDLAPAYQTELTAGQGRRLALVTALLPAGMLTADLMWWQPPDVSPATPPTAFLVMVEVLDWTSYAVGALAVLALVALWRGARRGHDPRRIVRTLALAAVAACTLIWGLGTFAAVESVYADPRALTWPPMLAAWAMLNGMGGYLVWRGLRCVAATRAAVVAC